MMQRRCISLKKTTLCFCILKQLRITSFRHGLLLLLKLFIIYFIVNIFITFIHQYMSISYKTQENIPALDMRTYIPDKSPNITGNSDNNVKLNHPLLQNFQKGNQLYCDGRIKFYNRYFAVLNNVTVDLTKVKGVRKGGENISEVLKQTERDEVIETQPGFFRMSCENKPPHSFSSRKDHLKAWESSLDIIKGRLLVNYTEGRVTFAIVRTDYANLYWVTVQLYDIFILTKFLGLNINNVGVLFVDAHPFSQVDHLWWTLFPKVTRTGHMSHTVLYRSLVWGLPRAESPLLKKSTVKPPFLYEFKEFVLSKINSIKKRSEINCNNVTVTIIFRRDYVAHPRNPSGRVSRKIANDEELFQNVNLTLKGHNVKGVQLDNLPIVKQVELASQTDILVGMHGAGLTYTTFLPSHAALIEMFPMGHSRLSHFQYIASWRPIKYLEWQNKDKSKEIDKYTTFVDVPAITSLIQRAYKLMCPL